MTETQRKALTIIRDNNITMPRQFGQLLWPDNPGWKRRGKAGPKGVAKGTGMNLASGAYLGKLRKAGLIGWHYTAFGELKYFLTEKGKELLSDGQEESKTG